MSAATVDNLALCYQGIQRDYRNTVIGHIRANLQKAFPQDYLEKAKGPFLREWDEVNAAAEERRRTGELEAPLVDDIDVLGVNNFFNLFDSYAEQLIPATAGTQDDPRK